MACRAFVLSTKWTASGASFERSIDMIRQRLGANPIAMQLPIGSEASFPGRGRPDDHEGDLSGKMNWAESRVEIEIPADLLHQAAEIARHAWSSRSLRRMTI